jgi:glycosyltransferase involved in cell wall biosynthesis
VSRYLLVSGDFVHTGGMDKANHALAAYLAARGDEVHLAAHRVAPDLLAQPNVTWHRAAKPLNSYLLAAPFLDRLGRRLARGIAAGGGRVVVNGANCAVDDVNWVHYVHAAWTSPPSGGAIRRIKAAVDAPYQRTIERSRIGRARLVIANSRRTRLDLIERVGVDPGRVRTIYLGVDPDQFRPPSEAERTEARARMGWSDGRPVVAFVGAMGDRRKGFDTLYEAWKRLASGASWDARLAVVGAGASLAWWSARAEAEGLSDAIEFLGFREDVPAILAGCDVLVSPARYEAYGLNVHEALCCGLPALVSAAAGVAEQYPEGLSGLLLPDPDDADDLAERLRSWRSRAEGLRAEVAPLSARLRARTWEVMAREIVEATEA